MTPLKTHFSIDALIHAEITLSQAVIISQLSPKEGKINSLLHKSTERIPQNSRAQ